MRIRFGPLALLAVLAFFTAAAPAEAKEGSYLDGARLFGFALGERSVDVAIALPENYVDMYRAEPPTGVWGSVAQSAGYHIEVRYDFSADGYGTRTRLGWYDGKDRIFFSEPMSVGPGTWEAGWFTASPLLAATLQHALAPTPPAAGNSATGPGAGGPDSNAGVGTSLVVLIAVVSAMAFAGRHTTALTVTAPARNRPR